MYYNKLLANRPLCIEALSDGESYFSNARVGNWNVQTLNLYYKVNDGEWQEYDYLENIGLDTPTYYITLNKGDKLYLRGDNPNGLGCGTSNDNFVFMFNKTVSSTTQKFKISGDLCSLLGRFITETEGKYAFKRLFYGNGLTTDLDVSELNINIKSAGTNALVGMFYKHSFSNGLLPILPKNTTRVMAQDMFNNSTGIKEATLNFDFVDYGSLAGFFLGSEIEKATLNFGVLGENSCKEMFKNCQYLTEVTAYFTDVSATNCLQNMFSGVTTTGTLYVLPQMVENEYILSVLPATWTIAAIEE